MSNDFDNSGLASQPVGQPLRFHEALSGSLLIPFSRLRRRLHPRQRKIMRFYDLGLRFRREHTNFSEEQKLAWILSALRKAVRRAYQHTSYYHRLFDSVGFNPAADFTFEDYARLPVLTRDQIHNADAELISREIPRKRLKKDATGGSTGTPTVIWRGPEESGWSEGGISYFMRKIGVPEGSSMGYLWGHNLDPVASDSLRDRLYSFQMNERWFDCFRLSPEILERYHREFERWRPACILAYATALGSLAEYLAERNYVPSYPTRCAITGAEKLLPHHRQLFERVFHKPVYERYGSRDAGAIAFQTDPGKTLDFEVDWVNTLVEPASNESESDILITKLHADGMPMLRYRLGDVGTFPPGSRPGHPVLTLKEIVGRATDRVWLPDGGWINGIELPHLLKDFPVREFVLIQHEDYSTELRVVVKPGFDEEAERQILAILGKNLRGVSVVLRHVDEIPRTLSNKWRPVFSEVRPHETNADGSELHSIGRKNL